MSSFAQRPTRAIASRIQKSKPLNPDNARLQWARVKQPDYAATLSPRVPNRVLGHVLRSVVRRATDLSSGDQDSASAETAETSGEASSPSFWRKVTNVIFGGKLDKERIKALGIGAVLSYGFVSNVSYGACVVVAWITQVKKTGLSPLAPGQWGGFLAVYAALWALQNILRPIRFTLAVAMTPVVDRMLTFVQKKLSISKPKAFGVLLFGLGICTMSILVFFLWILGGFPNLPSPLKVT